VAEQLAAFQEGLSSMSESVIRANIEYGIVNFCSLLFGVMSNLRNEKLTSTKLLPLLFSIELCNKNGKCTFTFNALGISLLFVSSCMYLELPFEAVSSSCPAQFDSIFPGNVSSW
jgi:hypothetical protein